MGNAYSKILNANFLDTYQWAFLIPLPLRPRYLMLLQRNHAAFQRAKALGGEPVE
jgi:hypothetical protein